MKRPLFTALLYAAAALGANAQSIPPELRTTLIESRIDEMRKMIIHPAPEAAQDAVFYDASGGEHRLADNNGKIRLVNFWATWCAPCREEMPTLAALQDLLGSADFEVMAIATGRNRLEGIQRFYQEAEVSNLPILLDPRGALGNKFGALGLPLTVILNREGEEIARLTGGADWASENAIEILQAIIDLDSDS